MTNAPIEPRYELSFTSGGLLATESASVAALYAADRDWSRVRQGAAEEIQVQLVTSDSKEPDANHRQLLMLKLIKDASDAAGVHLGVKFDESIHYRRITTGHGWRIDLGKGLDIWQKGSDNSYNLGRYRQKLRLVGSGLSVHYHKITPKPEAD